MFNSDCCAANKSSTYHCVIACVAHWPCVQRQQRLQRELWGRAFSLGHIPPVLHCTLTQHSQQATPCALSLPLCILCNADTPDKLLLAPLAWKAATTRKFGMK